jgi:hypothetical protein
MVVLKMSSPSAPQVISPKTTEIRPMFIDTKVCYHYNPYLSL